MADVTAKNGPGTTPTPAAEDTSARTVTVTPRVDLLETENEFLLLADLPGVKPGDVDIRFEQGELVVHGRRPAPHAGKPAAVREYEATNYYRAFAVADTVAADQISADLKNGVLTVRLPKIEAVKPRKIIVRG